MQRMKVVLPEPEAPINTTTSPRRTCREMPFRICSSPKALWIPSASMMGSSLRCAISTPPQQLHGLPTEHPAAGRRTLFRLAESDLEPALEKAPEGGQQQEIDGHYQVQLENPEGCRGDHLRAQQQLLHADDTDQSGVLQHHVELVADRRNDHPKSLRQNDTTHQLAERHAQ